MKTKLTVINKILDDFVRTSSSIQAAAVMSRDGMLIASNLNESVDSDRLSAISASLLSLAERATKDLQQGDLNQVLIGNTDGLILMLKVGEKAVLSVVSESSSSLGLLLHEAKKSAATIAHLV